MQFRPTALALAVVGLVSQAQAQQAAPAPEVQKIERVEVTGSLIKRTDKETPSVVQTITRDEIRNSGFATVEEMLRSVSSIDTSSISDGAASGFVAGLATISMRGLGSQGTLVLINGRRIAPVAAVDVNFGRGNLVSANTIPRAAIERVDILKDGASASYGSDAMAGVINYILRKEYQGFEVTSQVGAADRGVGKNASAGFTFGFGSLDSQRFNIFGGIDAFHRDAVGYSELKHVGDLGTYNQYQNTNGALSRYEASSVSSQFTNYYKVPNTTSFAGSYFGTNFLGHMGDCPAANEVGKGVPTVQTGVAQVLPVGMCRFNADEAAEAMAKQDRVNGMVRGTFAVSPDLTLFADLMVAKTKTTGTGTKYVFNQTLVTQAQRNANVVTWPLLSGVFKGLPAIILNANHPDNPTRGTASAQDIQIIPRFEDLKTGDISDLKQTRLTVGLEGQIGGWDIDSALLFSKIDSERTQQDRVRASLLPAAIANATYHFGKMNDRAAIATIASDAVNTGKSTVMSGDLRGSRQLFKLDGGNAAIALGVEARKEKLDSTPDANYLSGDYVGLVANGTSGTRKSWAAYTQLDLPVLKSLELQLAARHEHYDDFGNSNTGKAGFKWSAIPQTLAFRGTAGTGFRAPSLSQIGNSFMMSFHTFSLYGVPDKLRCPNGVSIGNPSSTRDCNVLGFSGLTPNPGSIPTVISANPNLKAETSRSMTLGAIFSPTKNLEMSLDAWYFKRDNEIRAQRGVDVMEAYNANPTGPAAANVLRNPDQATWLPGVQNSGPIIALIRGYDNYRWTKTSGLDYDAKLRVPTQEMGTFTFTLSGTYTARFDQVVLAGATPDRYVGTGIALDVPKTKASLRVDWRRADWTTWARFSHTDSEFSSTTGTCLTSTTAANTFLRNGDYCKIGAEDVLDLGVAYRGFKNWILTGSVLNATANYTQASGVPSAWTYWNPGTPGQLGRRFSVGATYSWE
ncbi:TonB-dependent receptor [Pelomonas sp. SE-A7]|uniref:TonB-dependent receptor plug domain-containing protein n=1 Tax=Pelomonas sp. SE-A7 TaxID=3054953 RepID=UPI00259CE7FB|nr:TonB-dependent receptor [Pelomonas sp. SE-A7]MDM4768136.1 TonB-dependent receptor [Pelomonas sp. SE-A7]